MRLILMRHADAGERDPARYPDDDARPLSRKGRDDHRRVTLGLSRMGLVPERLLSSPLLRAKETAEVTASGLGFSGRIEVLKELGGEFSVRGLIGALAKLPREATVVAVGHEPDLSHFSAVMLEKGGGVGIDFKKSAVIGLDFDGHPAPGAGSLRYFIPPKVLLSLVGKED
jgi:phosphohistidine phosphatase